MKPNRSIPALIFGLLVTSQLAYAGDEMDELLNLSLEELSRLKLTTSTLREETLRSVPAAMSVYTREEIRRLGFTELDQLAALVPGFQVVRVDAFGNSRNLSNRGKPITDIMRSLLILVDGQRINRDANGSAQYLSNFSLDNVERVEFIRGPGSALYGTNAMFGVINVITRSEREFNSNIGTSGQKSASAQWRLDGGAGKLELFVRGLSRQGESVALYDSLGRKEAGTYDPARLQDLSLRASIGEFSFSARESRRIAEQFYVYGYVANDDNLVKIRSTHVDLDWRHRFGNSISLQGRLWHSQMAGDFGTRLAGVSLLGQQDNREVGSEWLLQKDEGPHRWLLGFEWRQPKVSRNTLNDVPAGVENGRRIEGFFGQYQAEFIKGLGLTAGLRYDRYSDFGQHMSPRLGLVWQALPKDTLKLLYSEAFRAPSRVETDPGMNSAIRGNPALKPETAKTAELIWQHQFNQGLIESTLFHTRCKDAIVGAITPASQRTWENGHASYSGLELEARYHWQGWQLRIAASRLFRVEDQAETQSRNLLAGALGYAAGPWSGTLIGRYHSRMTDPNEQDGNIRTTEYSHMGSAALWGLHLSRKVGQNFEYYLHGENIFNRKILYPADNPSNFVGVPEQGRSIMIGVRWMADR